MIFGAEVVVRGSASLIYDRESVQHRTKYCRLTNISFPSKACSQNTIFYNINDPTQKLLNEIQAGVAVIHKTFSVPCCCIYIIYLMFGIYSN